MKKYFLFFFVAAITLSGCDMLSQKKNHINNNNTPGGKDGEMPVIKFDEEMHEFGVINQGEVVSYSYKFTNVGKADLVITDCRASCGCTVPNWPHQPIKPGESANIDVKFDSNGKNNDVNKEVTISSNCNPSTTIVKFHAFVKVPDKSN